MFLLEVMGFELSHRVDHPIPDEKFHQISVVNQNKNHHSREVLNLPGVYVIEQSIYSDVTPGRVFHWCSVFL